jgi:hypothetical protein
VRIFINIFWCEKFVRKILWLNCNLKWTIKIFFSQFLYPENTFKNSHLKFTFSRNSHILTQFRKINQFSLLIKIFMISWFCFFYLHRILTFSLSVEIWILTLNRSFLSKSKFSSNLFRDSHILTNFWKQIISNFFLTISLIPQHFIYFYYKILTFSRSHVFFKFQTRV